MEDSGLITEDSSKVEYVSLTQIFEEQCPIYMSYGMSYDEFWHGEPHRAVFYREAKKIAVRQRDEELWMQGVYIYDTLCRVSPIFHAFSKSGTKPLPYVEKPYSHMNDATQNNEDVLLNEQEQERLKAQVQFDAWMRGTKKHFENNK